MSGSGKSGGGGKAGGSKGSGGGGGGGAHRNPTGGARKLTTRVRTAKGRKISSTRWLQRQLNDPYVVAAQKDGLRSRAAYKLIQLDDRLKLLKPGLRIVDLGAAPGGWSIVAASRVGVDADGSRARAGKPDGQVIALDITETEQIAGVTILTMDFMADDAEDALLAALGGHPADGVISDMAAPSTGHKQTDHLRIIGLCEAALDFALRVLAPGGFFLAKVLQGGTEGDMLKTMKHAFETVRHIKPEASRADSAELYVVATGFRGVTSLETDGPPDNIGR